MKILFLGTGTSHGVPMVGCKCPVCTSSISKNKRFRSAVYINTDNLSLLIDTPPELRLMLLEYQITAIDGILYTHPHADHLMGFDDIRAINRLTSRQIPCYGNHNTIQEINTVFPYINNALQKGGGLPEVFIKTVEKPFFIKNTKIIPLQVEHGLMKILGYRIANLAYITDCSHIPSSTMEKLDNLDLLILGALRYRKHPTHMNIEQALKVIKEIGVPRVYLTHISHELDHELVNYQLPDNIQLAYDGLEIVLY